MDWLLFVLGFLGSTLLYLIGIAVFAFLWVWVADRWLAVRNRLWPPPPPPPLNKKRMTAFRKELRQLQTYCWYLEKAEGRRRSHLGAVPYMRPDRPWPRSKDRSMSFVAQINLRDLRAKDGPEWLPEAGILLFFVDLEAGEWAVIHEPDTKAVRAAQEPDDLPTDGRKVIRYREKPVFFRRARSWPDWERLKTRPSEDEEQAVRRSLQIAEPPEPTHQIGGFPLCVQGDWMEWEVEMEARGIRPKSFAAWLKTPEAAALEPDVRQWKLLLQVDSDPDTGFHWVDSGVLYFWIREQDARAGNFSAAKMIAQFC